MSDPRKAIVRNGYDAIAERYLDWARDAHARRVYLDKLLALLPDRANVLELGCGAGTPATKAIAARAGDCRRHLASPDRARRDQRTGREIPLRRCDGAGFSRGDVRCGRRILHGHAHPARGTCRIVRARRELVEASRLFRRHAGRTRPGRSCRRQLARRTGLLQPLRGGGKNMALVRSAGFGIEESAVVAQELKGEEGTPFLWIVARKL